MTESPNLRLDLAGRAENVSLVREVLAGLADAVAFGHALDDVKAAVSEACNNVVVHAYGGDEGPLEVEIRVRPGELEVIVRDQGIGLESGAPGAGETEDEAALPSRGIGLAVIEALSTSAQIRSRPLQGSEVAMLFEIPERRDLSERGRGGSSGHARPEPITFASEIAVEIAPPALSAAILNRLVGALAARAGFSIDRLSDAQLVTDSIAARVGSVLDVEPVSFGIDVSERALALRVGPLPAGAWADFLADPALGEPAMVLARLTDELDVETSTAGEVLSAVMRDALEPARPKQ